MRTVKFESAGENEKNFAAAIRKNVYDYLKENNLSTKGGAEMWTKAFVMFTIYFAPFVLLMTVPVSAWLAIILVIIMGIGEASIGMSVMHDAAHGAFSRRKWVNSMFASSIVFLGSNLVNWKIQHNLLHHTFTNIDSFDQDIDSKGNLRLSEHSPLKKGHRTQYFHAFFLYGLMTLAKFVTEINQLLLYNKMGLTKEQGYSPTRELIKVITIKLLYLAVIIGLPLFLTDYTWWQVLIGFAIMHLTAGMIMSTVFQMAHVVEGTLQPLPDENGVIKHDWVVHQLMTTSDFARGNAILNWYVGGLNFQIEHHLFTNICHLNYRKIAPVVEQTAKEYGFGYNLKPSLSAAFRSHVQRLKELGRARSMV